MRKTKRRDLQIREQGVKSKHFLSFINDKKDKKITRTIKKDEN